LVRAPGAYKRPDLEKLKTESTEWFKEWLTSAGFTLQGDKGEVLMNRVQDIWGETALLVPDVDPTNPKMKILTYFLAMAELKDDLPEMKSTIAAQKEKALQIGLIGGEIIQGKIKSMDDLPPVYPEVTPVFKALFLAAARARENIPDFLSNCKYFVKTTDESFIGLALAALDSIMEDWERLPEDSFLHLHRYESGLETFFELGALIVGITLPDSMRTNILFSRVMELAAKIYTLQKDLFKVRPDLAKDHPMSLINFKSKKVPLKQAFDETVKLINDHTINFIAACERLRILYPKNKRLDKFLSGVENVIDGHIYYSARNKKYGDVEVKFLQKQGVTGEYKPLQSDAVRSSNIEPKNTWG